MYGTRLRFHGCTTATLTRWPHKDTKMQKSCPCHDYVLWLWNLKLYINATSQTIWSWLIFTSTCTLAHLVIRDIRWGVFAQLLQVWLCFDPICGWYPVKIMCTLSRNSGSSSRFLVPAIKSMLHFHSEMWQKLCRRY